MRLRPQRPARENAARVLPKLARKFFQDLDDGLASDLNPKKAHDLRIVTKRFRYALEYFRPCYGETLDAYLTEIRELQHVMGALNDCRSTRKLLGRLLADGPRPSRPKKLFAALGQRETDLLDESRKVWRGGFRSGRERQRLLRYLSHPTQPRPARKPPLAPQPVEMEEPEAVA